MCPKGTYYCALHMVISHLRITHDSYTQNPDSYTWGLTGIEDLPHGEPWECPCSQTRNESHAVFWH